MLNNIEIFQTYVAFSPPPSQTVQQSLPSQDVEDPVVNEPLISSERIQNNTLLPEKPSISSSERIHDNTFSPENAHLYIKIEIEILKQLFSKDNLAQLRLAHLESQLNSYCFIIIIKLH